MEHHRSLTVPSSPDRIRSALLQGHPSQQSREKGKAKSEGGHLSLLPARRASSTNFSTVSAPHPPLTNSLKTKLEKPRRCRVLWLPPIAKDVSTRVRHHNTHPSARPAVSAPYNLHTVHVHIAAHCSSHLPHELPSWPSWRNYKIKCLKRKRRCVRGRRRNCAWLKVHFLRFRVVWALPV